jgi:hypothetical protein
VSAGIGYVINHIFPISRYSVQIPGFYTAGQNNSQEPFIPLRIGYDFKVFNKYEQPAFKVDVGYQTNFVFGNGLDGFTTTSNYKIYTQFTVGVKFALGGAILSYRKQIHY